MRVDRLMVVFAMGCGMAYAQQTIGTVGLQGATVGGALVVSNGRAVLAGSTTVTAGEHTSEVSLSRGGKVLVCATSGLHLTAGSGDGANAPLMLALDRGALEVQMAATRRDVVMTPDLRFTMASDGPLDLRLRVTRNGDTCVENRGARAPVLHIADQFGGASYDLHAGQHVLFEHGDLREVVDHESSECGCPAEPTMTVADALIHPGGTGAAEKPSAAKTAEEAHPFPAAVSAGLAPVSSTPPQAPKGEVHMQVAATLSSGGGADSTTQPDGSPVVDSSDTAAKGGVGTGGAASSSGATTQSASAPAPISASAPPAMKQQESKGLFHSVGRFFRRIFGGG